MRDYVRLTTGEMGNKVIGRLGIGEANPEIL